MAEDKLPGLDWTKFSGIKVIEEGEKKKVVVGNRPYIDYAARHLCGDLNQMRPYTVDRFHLPIHYEVL